MAEPQQRSWWGRNWKWVVPVGCLTPVVLCGGFITVIVAIVFGALKSTEPYKAALIRAQASPAVQAALGQPVEADFLVTGNVRMNTANGVESGTAELSFPIHGPNGSGTVEVSAKKATGKWTYSRMRVVIPGKTLPIDLLTEESTTVVTG
jgi:hypothetical protein